HSGGVRMSLWPAPCSGSPCGPRPIARRPELPVPRPGAPPAPGSRGPPQVAQEREPSLTAVPKPAGEPGGGWPGPVSRSWCQAADAEGPGEASKGVTQRSLVAKTSRNAPEKTVLPGPRLFVRSR
ncbi:hypothetical protein H1C71_030541, partial [Ictidomys tridecemlineatus]